MRKEENMENLMKDIVASRMAAPLECQLKKDVEFQNCREKFSLVFGKLQKKLEGNKKESKLLDEMNKAMNDYICRYGEAAYCMGFHDGMGLGLEHVNTYGQKDGMKELPRMSVEDMTHLIYIMDAYRQLNITFCGEEMMLGFDEGCIGSLSRIYKVITHNVCAEMRENDFAKEDEILLDTLLTPEERAEKLLGK